MQLIVIRRNGHRQAVDAVIRSRRGIDDNDRVALVQARVFIVVEGVIFSNYVWCRQSDIFRDYLALTAVEPDRFGCRAVR